MKKEVIDVGEVKNEKISPSLKLEEPDWENFQGGDVRESKEDLKREGSKRKHKKERKHKKKKKHKKKSKSRSSSSSSE